MKLLENPGTKNALKDRTILQALHQYATDVSMWEWGVFEVCSIHIYSLKHHIYIYIIIPLFHQRIPAKWVCTKKNGYPKHEFQFGTYGKVMINIEISKFFMVFPSCFSMFFA